MENITEKRFSLKKLREYVLNGVRVFRTILKERPALVASYFLLVTISGIAPYAQSYFLGNVVNALGKGNMHTMTVSLIILGAVVLLLQIIYLLQRHFQRLFVYFIQAFYDLRTLNYRAQLDIAQYEDKNFGNLMSRINEKGSWTVNSFIEGMFFAFQSTIAVLAIIFIGSSVSWWVLLIVVVTAIPELLANIKFSQQSWYIWGNDIDMEERRKTYDVRYHFNDTRVYLTEIKLYQTQNWFIRRVQNFLNRIYGKQVENANQSLKIMIVSKLVSMAGLFGALVLLVVQILHGQLQIGTFIFLFTAITGFQNEITGLFNNLASQFENSKYINDLMTFYDTKPQIKNGPVQLGKDTAPKIQFRHVWFKYPSGSDYVLEDFTLTVEPGQKLALIGLNGAGKTTFVKLLCRFYDVEKGEILIDDVNIKNIDLNTLYKKIGVVFQEYGKYEMTIAENIVLGDVQNSADTERLHEAAKSAGAYDFIQKLKGRFNQQLGNSFTDGIELSVGQWQKLALTRLFYRNPSLYILDEPTASIDAESEMHIFEQLNTLSKNKTVVMISHRFNTVKNADKIVVIQEGKIVEQGTHTELMENEKGEYRKLFLMQKGSYE